MKLTSSLAALALLAICHTTPAIADSPSAQLIGADELIQTLLTESEDAGDEPTSPYDVFVADLKQYIEDFTDLTTEQAAKQWVALLDRYAELAGQNDFMAERFHSSHHSDVHMRQFVKFIPGPETWPQISAALDQRTTGTNEIQTGTNMLFRLLMAGLQEDEQATSKVVSELEKRSEKGSLDEVIREIRESFMTTDNLPVGERFAKLLEIRRENLDESSSIDVPDLVHLVGKQEAEKLLREALLLPNTTLNFSSPGATVDLAQEIALVNIDTLPGPQWDLVEHLGSADLYEAMTRRFSNESTETQTSSTDMEAVSRKAIATQFGMATFSMFASSSSTSRSQADREKTDAKAYYFYDLINAGRMDEAREFLRADTSYVGHLSYRWRPVQRSVPAAAIYQVLSEWLKEIDYNVDKNAKSIYGLLINLARQSGDLDGAAEFLKTAVASDNVDAALKSHLYDNLATINLELNQPAAAVENLHAAVEVSPAEDFSENNLAFKSAVKIYDIGKLLDNPEWIELGLSLAETKMMPESDTPTWRIDHNLQKFIDMLLESNRIAQAEKILHTHLKSAIQSEDHNNHRQILFSLVSVYGKEQRYDDIITLMENAPWWGPYARDMSDVLHAPTTNAARYIARALADRGEKDRAIRILKHTITIHPKSDLLYDELTTMTGVEIIPWLDRLYEYDQFEERPIMWKAIVWEQAGDLDQAETAARQAIKIDPTDGEQTAGQRIQAYAVLVRILEKKGENDEAKTLNEIVRSVRLAERGDALNEMGLVSQAIDVYQQSSRIFSDAYCVEWRLARRLQEQGDDDGAREHYEKAFTMMPQQFGRMANLCFGCESVFAGAQVQSIAERILLPMTKEADVSPTVFFLLASLRTEQSRHIEAAEFLRKAIELDPNYYDALEDLWDMRNSAFIPRAEQQKIARKLLELDPFLKHFRELKHAHLPPALLWNAGYKVYMRQPEPLQEVWPLKANAAAITSDAEEEENYKLMMAPTAWGHSGSVEGPGEFIVSQPWISSFLYALQHLRFGI